MQEDIYILGIESSCDDTSAAVLKNGVLLSNVTASQAVHEAYGGVVPELASRAHQQNVVPVVDQAIKRAGITKEQLSAVAFTRGPGLMGSLLVGVSFARGDDHGLARLVIVHVELAGGAVQQGGQVAQLEIVAAVDVVLLAVDVLVVDLQGLRAEDRGRREGGGAQTHQQHQDQREGQHCFCGESFHL